MAVTNPSVSIRNRGRRVGIILMIRVMCLLPGSIGNIAEVEFRSEEQSTYGSSVQALIMVLVGSSLAFAATARPPWPPPPNCQLRRLPTLMSTLLIAIDTFVLYYGTFTSTGTPANDLYCFTVLADCKSRSSCDFST